MRRMLRCASVCVGVLWGVSAHFGWFRYRYKSAHIGAHKCILVGNSHFQAEPAMLTSSAGTLGCFSPVFALPSSCKPVFRTFFHRGDVVVFADQQAQ